MDVEVMTWITYMDRQNCPKKHRNIVRFQSIIGGEFLGHYRFKEKFYEQSDILTVFQEHIDKVLEFKLPVGLDDIIFVTNGTAVDSELELREILSKLHQST